MLRRKLLSLIFTAVFALSLSLVGFLSCLTVNFKTPNEETENCTSKIEDVIPTEDPTPDENPEDPADCILDTSPENGYGNNEENPASGNLGSDFKKENGIPNSTTYGYLTFTSLGNSKASVKKSSTATNATKIEIPWAVMLNGKFCYVTEIEENAFYSLSKLETINLPETITTIKGGAFASCPKLKSIFIPKSVTKIEASTLRSVFSGSTGLTSINVDKDNPNYYSENSTGTLKYNAIIEKSTQILISGCQKTIIPGDVLIINDYAFSGQSTIKSMNIPSKVEKIKKGAFKNCSRLGSITIPSSTKEIGNDAFYSCSLLETVTLNDGLTTIGDSAFKNCLRITKIKMPDSITTVGSEAFYGCQEITSATLSKNLRALKSQTFYQCTSLPSITIPASVSSIETRVFSYCTSLTAINVDKSSSYFYSESTDGNEKYNAIISRSSQSLISGCKNTVMPRATKIIESYAFERHEITSLTFKENVTTIKASAFSYSSLESAIIPDNITSIGSYAFEYCKQLTSIEIGKGLVFFGIGAFSYCDSLNSINVDADNSHFYSESTDGLIKYNAIIENITFKAGCKTSKIPSTTVTTIGSSAFRGHSGLTEITIPSNITTIDSSAFSNTSLTKIDLPTSLKTIGSQAFWGCDFTSVTIPDSVTSLDTYAFAYCEDLTEITFGRGITEIPANCFSYCKGLIDITIPGHITTIKVNAFSNCSSLQTVMMEDGVTTLDAAFANCNSLKNVSIPDSIMSISSSAFSSLAPLTYNTYGNIKYLGNSSNKYLVAIKAWGYSTLTSYTINSNCKLIMPNVFSSCDTEKISSITFENTSSWKVSSGSSFDTSTSLSVTNSSKNIEYFKDTYYYYYWRRG